MQAYYPAAFERDMGCTEADLMRWLPGALRGAPLHWQGQAVRADLEGGVLHLRWQTLEPRRIGGLVAFPRLQVWFRFEGLEEAARQAVMRYFDLYTQRGGG